MTINRKNKYFIFLPFLILYILIILISGTPSLQGDEPRFLWYAQNLLNGFYSPPAPDIYLWNGPGYPIYLMPFVYFNIPITWMRLSNALLHYLSIIYLFDTLIRCTKIRTALIACLAWGCYFLAYQEMPKLLTETLTTFLLVLAVNQYSLGVAMHSKRHCYLAGFTLGLLALTKVIFGYVLLGLLVTGILSLIIKNKLLPCNLAVVSLVALATCSPYLAYTYKLTGRHFLWSNSGGMNLYWMSTPVESEYGDWNNEEFKATCGLNQFEPCNDWQFANHHSKDLEQIKKFTSIERDEEYKKLAIKNIKSNPKKYIMNCFANIGRLLFNFPFSYKYQEAKTLIRFIPNSIILCLGLFCLPFLLLNWKKLDLSIKFIFITLGFYLTPTILLSAHPRQFNVIVPLIILLIAYILDRTISIKQEFN
jgi:4-amino-4-deoxy-L-arabinose transferase-like glycosyltransferase